MRWLVQIDNLFVLFCEDIREEKDGKVSYMGVLGTGVAAASFPLAMPKLCIGLGAEVKGHQPVRVACEVESDLNINLPRKFEHLVEPPEVEAKSWNLRLNINLTNVTIDREGSVIARLWVENADVESELRFFTGITELTEIAAFDTRST